MTISVEEQDDPSGELIVTVKVYSVSIEGVAVGLGQSVQLKSAVGDQLYSMLYTPAGGVSPEATTGIPAKAAPPIVLPAPAQTSVSSPALAS